VRFIAVLVAMSACIDTPPLSEPVVEASHVAVWEVPESLRAQTDLLIFVDDTQAMQPYRERLANVPQLFADRLAWYTQRWIDLRVAVATSDGRLRRLPGATDAWLSDAYDFDYTHHTNYAGTLADNLATLMDVGAANDAPSMPLDAARRALETGSQLVRDRAGLMILTITASDDASPLAVADYLSWFRRAVEGAWQRDWLLSGIYPKGSPRLDEYYGAMERSIVSPIEDGYYAQALPWVPGDTWGLPPCIEGVDLDPTTDELELECALMANVNAEWRTIPACTPQQRVERTERELPRSEPSAPCWWLRQSAIDCGSATSYMLDLGGYTRTQHPELRFECRTQ
jgi:hypothetical protein